jgi:hypothetical protein
MISRSFPSDPSYISSQDIFNNFLLRGEVVSFPPNAQPGGPFLSCGATAKIRPRLLPFGDL